MLIFALVASIMLIAYYAYVHIFAGLEIIRRGRAGLVGEARPASFSNHGCPTDYNSEYIPSHHEYCCTSDYFLMVNLGSTFLVLDL